MSTKLCPQVAGAAEQIGAGQRAVCLIESDGVIAAEAESLEEVGIGDGRGAAPVDEHGTGCVSAEEDAVGIGVSEDAKQARA
jgi:hypothetical protein